MIKKFLFTISLFGIVVLSAISSETINQVVSRMKASNLSSAFGSNKEEGDYFIVLTKTTVSAKMNPNQAEELARIQAKKSIAAFFGQDITANEETSFLSKTVFVDGKEKEEMEETFKSFMRTDISQLLRGAKEISLTKAGDTITSIYLVSDKSKSLSNKLSSASSSELDSSVPEYNSSDSTVISIGVATIIKNRVDEAKKMALNRAMQNAVEQVLGTMLASTTQVQDLEKVKSKIFSNTVGFIDNYRIKEEGVSGGSYKINGSFTVSKNKLYDSYKSMLQTIGDPYFYVVAINDKELTEKFWEFFSDLGFKITDKLSAADYIIELNGKFAKRKHPIDKREGTQLSLWIKIFNYDTRKLLFSIKNDPRKACVFIGDAERQHELAIKKALAQVKEPLHHKINSAVMQLVQSGREITINIENYSSAYKRFLNKWEKSIEFIPGVSDLSTDINSDKREVTFTVNYSGKVNNLSDFLNDRLSKEMPKKYLPDLIDQTSNSITFEY